MYGAKLVTIMNFDWIASLDNSPRPTTYSLARGPPHTLFPKDMVVKRGYSGYGNYVIFPEDKPENRTWSHWPPSPFHSVNMSWFQQQPILQLKIPNIGEIRCFFAGGTFCHAVHTTRAGGDKINVDHVSLVVPLDRIT